MCGARTRVKDDPRMRRRGALRAIVDTGIPYRLSNGAQSGLWRTFDAAVVLGRRGKASAEQVQLGASVHLPFDELELGDLAFGLAV
jgi:hypothetical protein